jgi:hypothetical protein
VFVLRSCLAVLEELRHVDVPAKFASCAHVSQHLDSLEGLPRVGRSGYQEKGVRGVCLE